MAYGDIGAAVNTREFDLSDITHPDMIHIAGDIYAVAYSNNSGNGEVITIDITKEGVIGASIEGWLEFDAVDGWYPSIVHVAGEIYAIAYRGVDADGFVITVKITAAGAITAVAGGSLEFEETACYEPDMIKVPDGSGVFAIVCRGNINQGIITTIGITDAGAISAIETKEAWATNVNNPRFVHVEGNIFAIVYRDNAYDGHVCTVEIDTEGAIEATVEATLEFDVAQGTDPRITHVSDNIFAIAYRGPGDDGWVLTVTITALGAIAFVGGAAGKVEFDAERCAWPDIIHLAGGVCAIAYQGDADDGYLATIQVDVAGQITLLKNLEIDAANGGQPSIVRVGGNQYAIAYLGSGLDGFINTPTIITPGGPKLLMMMGMG